MGAIRKEAPQMQPMLKNVGATLGEGLVSGVATRGKGMVGAGIKKFKGAAGDLWGWMKKNPEQAAMLGAGAFGLGGLGGMAMGGAAQPAPAALPQPAYGGGYGYTPYRSPMFNAPRVPTGYLASATPRTAPSIIPGEDKSMERLQDMMSGLYAT